MPELKLAPDIKVAHLLLQDPTKAVRTSVARTPDAQSKDSVRRSASDRSASTPTASATNSPRSSSSSPRLRKVEGGLSRQEVGNLRYLRKLEKGMAWLHDQGKTAGYVDLEAFSHPDNARVYKFFPDYLPPLGLCTFVKTSWALDVRKKIDELENKDLGLEEESAPNSVASSPRSNPEKSSARSSEADRRPTDRSSSDKASKARKTESGAERSDAKSSSSNGTHSRKDARSDERRAGKRHSRSTSSASTEKSRAARGHSGSSSGVSRSR